MLLDTGRGQLDLIRTWRADGFQLFVWDTYCRDGRGQSHLAYRLYDTGRLIFDGRDFSGSPMHADDSDATVAGLLGFLSLKPGDTDREYFDAYTPEQMAWVESGRADDLSMLQIELEEQAR